MKILQIRGYFRFCILGEGSNKFTISILLYDLQTRKIQEKGKTEILFYFFDIILSLKYTVKKQQPFYNGCFIFKLHGL